MIFAPYKGVVNPMLRYNRTHPILTILFTNLKTKYTYVISTSILHWTKLLVLNFEVKYGCVLYHRLQKNTFEITYLKFIKTIKRQGEMPPVLYVILNRKQFQIIFTIVFN